MALDADTLLDRMQLKQQVSKWRTLAIVIAALAAVVIFGKIVDINHLQSSHIARISIEGVIVEDPEQLELIRDLKEDDSVKAVIVRLDTPGGTVVGGEEFYLALRDLSEAKPVVAVMKTICTSAGYMTALGTDYLIAREGTITGSIGVIMQSLEFTKLAKDFGITPVTIKSGENKAVPNPLEPLDATQRKMAQAVVNDFFEFFLDLVAERRGLNDEEMDNLVDGRIFTGHQAMEAKLIDEIGGEDEAVAWLVKQREIGEDLEIRDAKPKQDIESFMGQFEELAKESIFSIQNLSVTLDGLVSIWQPALQHK